MTTIFLNLPPHLLPSSTPHLLNTAALWYPKWTKYLLNSSLPQLRRSLVPQVDKIPPHLLPSSTPPLSGTPSGQNTSSPPQLRRSLVPQWTKYLLTSSPTPLFGTPSGQNTSSPPQLHHFLAPQVAPPRSLAAQMAPICSRAPQVDKIPPPSSTSPLSGAPSGAFWRLSWQLSLLSSATSGNGHQKNHFILLACDS